jgi:hypothetical protein
VGALFCFDVAPRTVVFAFWAFFDLPGLVDIGLEFSRVTGEKCVLRLFLESVRGAFTKIGDRHLISYEISEPVPIVSTSFFTEYRASPHFWHRIPRGISEPVPMRLLFPQSRDRLTVFVQKSSLSLTSAPFLVEFLGKLH